MSERPILFSGAMVRAILAGTKTQTRRVLKQATGPSLSVGMHETIKRVRCPYGQPGDRLWVREAFSGSIAYERHGYPLKEWGNKLWYWADGNPERGDWTRPKPSIHMPRGLSRITLEVTEVRVERLQDISPRDCEAEGVTRLPLQDGAPNPWYTADVSAGQALHSRSTIGAYHKLWNSINGPGSWDANPWVWAVSFRRII